MTAILQKDGYIRITAENIAEGFALKYLFPFNKQSNDINIIIDTSIIIEENNTGITLVDKP